MKTVMKIAEKGGRQIIKHLPTILTVLGTGGVIVGTIMAAKTAPEAKVELDQAKEEWEAIPDKENRVKADYIFKLVRIGSKFYWKVGLVIGGSLVCFWVANYISWKRLMSALTTIGVMTKAKEELENKVEEIDGKKHLQKIKDEINAERLNNAPDIDQDKDYGPGESWFYEPGSGQYFRSNYEKIRQAANQIRDGMKSQILEGERYIFVPINEFLMDIGCKPCDFGNDLGFGLELTEYNMTLEKANQLVEDAVAIGFTSAFKNGVPVGVLRYDCRLLHESLFDQC